jgi:uncharacterized protein involved in copper resistance
MKNKIIPAAAAAVLAIGCTCLLFAQDKAAPQSSATILKGAYGRIKTNLQKAAEKMPQQDYNFKPADSVQTFGERVAHISNQISTCSAINGQRKPSSAAGKTAKADLVAALSESFAECDKTFDAVTDANAMEAVSAGRGMQPRINALYGIVVHANEVYGAMGVYMRVKGIVPPSSEGR